MTERRKISLVVSDVDGTLVTEDKVLTERAKAAVAALQAAGIRFAMTSGRPPLGMAMLLESIKLDTPLAGFNGGLFVTPQMGILKRRILPADVAAKSIELIRAAGLDVWVYRDNDWLVTRMDAPHVEREAWTVGFEPKIVQDVAANLDGVVKIVGVSDDHEKIQRCEAASQASFGDRATANRSQPYYLDVTHKDANKGSVVDFLSDSLGIARDEIATIGDQPNDVLMFRRSGLSIAMGNASDEVKAQASVTTASHEDEGFAKAMETFVLGGSAQARE